MSKNAKKRIYKIIIRSQVTCGSETWILNKKGKEALEIFERKILRIHGGTEVVDV